MAVAFGDDFEQFGVKRHDVGLLWGVAALVHFHLEFGEHFGGDEFADVVHVLGVVGRLQANEVELGDAQEALAVEACWDIRRSWRGG